MTKYRFDTPTASAFDDISQWVDVLLEGVSLIADDPNLFEDSAYPQAYEYLHDLRVWIAELPHTQVSPNEMKTLIATYAELFDTPTPDNPANTEIVVPTNGRKYGTNLDVFPLPLYDNTVMLAEGGHYSALVTFACYGIGQRDILRVRNYADDSLLDAVDVSSRYTGQVAGLLKFEVGDNYHVYFTMTSNRSFRFGLPLTTSQGFVSGDIIERVRIKIDALG